MKKTMLMMLSASLLISSVSPMVAAETGVMPATTTPWHVSAQKSFSNSFTGSVLTSLWNSVKSVGSALPGAARWTGKTAVSTVDVAVGAAVLGALGYGVYWIGKNVWTGGKAATQKVQGIIANVDAKLLIKNDPAGPIVRLGHVDFPAEFITGASIYAGDRRVEDSIIRRSNTLQIKDQAGVVQQNYDFRNADFRKAVVHTLEQEIAQLTTNMGLTAPATDLHKHNEQLLEEYGFTSQEREHFNQGKTYLVPQGKMQLFFENLHEKVRTLEREEKAKAAVAAQPAPVQPGRVRSWWNALVGQAKSLVPHQRVTDIVTTHTARHADQYLNLWLTRDRLVGLKARIELQQQAA